MDDNLKMYWEQQHYMDFLKRKIYKTIEHDGSKLCDCYHYTTLPTFWSLCDSDLMYARHVRFSNDSEEYELGEKIVNKILGYKNEEDQDFYMICFCEKKNLLSQWREYAKEGVCLGFNLDDEDYYTIRCNEITQTINEKSEEYKGFKEYAIPGEGWCSGELCSYAYAKPLKVFYTGKHDKKIKKLYEEIKKMLSNEGEIPKDRYMHCMIPYIKNKSFKEEAEARLIFQVKKDNQRYQIHYLKEDGLRKPYIKVEFGKIEEKKGDKCKIILDHIEDLYSVLENHKEEMQETLNIQIEYESRNKHNQPQIIIGCCNKQKEIFDIIDYWVETWNFEHKEKNIRVWCKGHLPIREIMVGPCVNKKEVEEGIVHYIHNIYWLKYVEVKCSNIPYRQKRIDR